MSGSAEIVRDLRAAQVPLFGLTNWSHELYPHAPRQFELLTMLDDVIVSGTEGVAKPDPRIFRITAERAGLPLDRLVFVDDRADNVAAADSLGMSALLFTDALALRRDLHALGLPIDAPCPEGS